MINSVKRLAKAQEHWFSVASVLEDLLTKLKVSNPLIQRAYLKLDEAGCYHNSSLIAAVRDIAKRVGVTVHNYHYSKPQSGKDICDGGLLRGISPSFQSRGGTFANFALLGGRAFDIPGAIPSSRHARRFLSAYNYTEDITRKNADWFICQGQGLVKACSQFYVRIFYGLSSQNYTTKNRELLT